MNEKLTNMEGELVVIIISLFLEILSLVLVFSFPDFCIFCVTCIVVSCVCMQHVTSSVYLKSAFLVVS